MTFTATQLNVINVDLFLKNTFVLAEALYPSMPVQSSPVLLVTLFLLGVSGGHDLLWGQHLDPTFVYVFIFHRFGES